MDSDTNGINPQKSEKRHELDGKLFSGSMQMSQEVNIKSNKHVPLILVLREFKSFFNKNSR